MNRNPFTHSVVSYPNRGSYGDNKWRGNCSGHIIKQAVSTYMDVNNKNALFVDPSMGSDTAGDVAREVGVRYKGLDLHSGFNLLRDDLLTTLQEEAQFIWWHPPYHSMIKYSRDVWAEKKPHPDDLSECESVSDFLEKSQIAMMNMYDALPANGNGTYCVLIANMRKNGKYYDLSGMLQRAAPGNLKDIVIKTQHNCRSDYKQYAKPIVRIAHESLLVFGKDKRFITSIDFAALNERRAHRLAAMTWRAAIKTVMRVLGTAHLSDIYEKMEEYAKSRGSNKNWKAKIRQVVRVYKDDFTALGNGMYSQAEVQFEAA